MNRPWRWAAPDPTRPWIITWTSLEDGQGAELRLLAKDKVVLEIGSGFGYSTACLALTAKYVHAIDPHNIKPGSGAYSMYELVKGYEETLPALDRLLRDLGVRSRVSTHFGYSQQLLGRGTVLEKLLRSEKTRLAFIDGDHSISGATEDFNNCARICNTLVVDDYDDDICPYVKPALDTWLSKRKGQLRTVGAMAVVTIERTK